MRLKIAIHSKVFAPEKVQYLELLFSELSKRNVKLVLSKDLADFVKEKGLEISSYDIFDNYYNLPDVKYIFSVGGDGTLLETITFVREKNIPILGINAGRLGFLATTPTNKIKEAVETLFNGFYSLDERSLIQLESNEDIFEGINFGLNEFTILKRDTSSMIVVRTFIDGEYLNAYWADGLIISTPTGSTGYSLSVGGPVVIPHSNNFIISPVSPHNLNVRPLIVSDKSVISFEIEGRSKNFLVSLDSRSRKVDANIQMAVKKCDFTIKLIKLHGDDFLNTLRRKLNWGFDARN